MWYIVSRRLTYMKHGSRYPDKPVGCRMFHRLLLSRWSWLWWSGWCSAPCPPALLHTALLSWGSCRCWSGHPGRAPNLPPVKINRTSWVALESNNTGPYSALQNHTKQVWAMYCLCVTLSFCEFNLVGAKSFSCQTQLQLRWRLRCAVLEFGFDNYWFELSYPFLMCHGKIIKALIWVLIEKQTQLWRSDTDQ